MVYLSEFKESERLKMYELNIKVKMSLQKIVELFDCTASEVLKIVRKIQTFETGRNL